MKSPAARLRFYPSNSKKSTRTGKVPLYAKVVYRGKKIEKRLPEDYDLSEKELIDWDNKTMSLRQRMSKTNAFLHGVDEFWKRHVNGRQSLSHEEISHILESGLKVECDVQVAPTVLQFCGRFMSEMIEPSNERKDGTKRNYRKAMKHFLGFLQTEKLENMPLPDFKYAQANAFKNYMMSEVVNNSAVSTSSNIRRIKTMFNEAINHDLITKNPFKGVKMTYVGDAKTPALGTEQVKAIIMCPEAIADPSLRFYRDMFLFGCFTGLSCISIQNLITGSLTILKDGNIKLDTKREKTKSPIVQIIPKAAQEIIFRYCDFNQGGRVLVFPKFVNEVFNHKLKVIGALLKLNISLSTKISRTTCAQMLVNVRYIDPVYKNYFMGWSNTGQIADVYQTLSDDVLTKNAEMINEYLVNNIGEEVLKNI